MVRHFLWTNRQAYLCTGLMWHSDVRMIGMSGDAGGVGDMSDRRGGKLQGGDDRESGQTGNIIIRVVHRLVLQF